MPLNQMDVKRNPLKRNLFNNASIVSVLGQVMLPSTLDVVLKCLDYKLVPNIKYQSDLGMDFTRQFRLVLDGNAHVNCLVHDDKIFCAATIDLLSTLSRIDDDRCIRPGS